MSWLDYLLLALIAAAAVLAVRYCLRHKSCSGCCENCGKNCCEKRKQTDENTRR